MNLVNKETLDEIALTVEEYQLIVETLGRIPNELELGMFGALWSEHCGYQHSKPLLRLLPSKGDRVLFPPGQENAGAVARFCKNKISATRPNTARYRGRGCGGGVGRRRY